ncbi:MAG: YitT family protein [Bacillota bacterium]
MGKTTGIFTELKSYTGILAGINLVAVGLVWFLIPNKIAAGGVSGLSIILFYTAGLPVGAGMMLINLPLFLVYTLVFGKKTGLKTIFGFGTLSLLIIIWTNYLRRPLTTDLLLASLYGGMVIGLGMGIVFYFQGTTGGTDLAARILHKYTRFRLGPSLMMMDVLIIIAAGVVFRQIDLSLFAMLTVFITAKAVDFTLEGLMVVKAVMIISDQYEAISRAILHELGRGVTGLYGQGKYSGAERQILYCVISRGEEMKLREIVRRTDPKAFMIISHAYEVLGEGFTEI